MIFVPYEKFENIEFIGEGGFSKIYKATWIDCKISDKGTLDYFLHNESKTVALKKLKNSKNITSKELNEASYLKITLDARCSRLKRWTVPLIGLIENTLSDLVLLTHLTIPPRSGLVCLYFQSFSAEAVLYNAAYL
ncbi:5865_t:CDS:2 [Rhizophagus irregularis]|nr:5865_t:CDS:2 [Rhizophagus irregularis]